MRKIILASVAMLSLGVAGSALAQSDAGATVGGAAGATGGAIAGGLVAGPIGAVVGGFAGAVIGSEAGVEATTVDYVVANPVEPIYVQAPIEVGATLAPDVVIHEVPTDPTYGYVYINDRAYIVDIGTRTIVQSPGYVIPQSTITYVEANPSASVTFEGDLVAGTQLGPDVELIAVPESSSYSYAYVNDRPVLVDNSSRTVVWVR